MRQMGRQAHIVHQHALNAILQSHRAGVTSSAGTSQLEQHIAILKSPVFDIATVLLNGRPDPRLQQLLDHTDHLAVILIVREAVHLATGLSPFPAVVGSRSTNTGPIFVVLLLRDVDDRLPGRDGLGDEREDLGADVRPVGVGVLGHGDKVSAVEHSLHAVNVHELRGQRGRVRGRDGAPRVEVLDERGRERLGEDAVVGEEFERVRIGGTLSLDEDGSSAEGKRC